MADFTGTERVRRNHALGVHTDCDRHGGCDHWNRYYALHPEQRPERSATFGVAFEVQGDRETVEAWARSVLDRGVTDDHDQVVARVARAAVHPDPSVVFPEDGGE